MAQETKNDTEGADTGVEPTAHDTVRVSRGTLAAVTRFVRRSEGPCNAVIMPVGADGVRVLLVGSDGVIGDQVVDDVATAKALVERVDGLELAEWDRDLSAVATSRKGHHRKMAGWVART